MTGIKPSCILLLYLLPFVNNSKINSSPMVPVFYHSSFRPLNFSPYHAVVHNYRGCTFNPSRYSHVCVQTSRSIFSSFHDFIKYMPYRRRIFFTGSNTSYCKVKCDFTLLNAGKSYVL